MSNQSLIEKKESKSGSCYYHPSKVAITKCFRCNKPICEKQLYDVNIYDYDILGDVCIPCLATLTQEDAKSKLGFYIQYFFLIVWSTLVLLIFFPLLIFSYFVWRNITNNHKKKYQLAIDSERNLEQFLTTINSTSQDIIISIANPSCFQCSTVLEPSDLYCKSCGDSLEFP